MIGKEQQIQYDKSDDVGLQHLNHLHPEPCLPVGYIKLAPGIQKEVQDANKDQIHYSQSKISQKAPIIFVICSEKITCGIKTKNGTKDIQYFLHGVKNRLIFTNHNFRTSRCCR